MPDSSARELPMLISSSSTRYLSTVAQTDTSYTFTPNVTNYTMVLQNNLSKLPSYEIHWQRNFRELEQENAKDLQLWTDKQARLTKPTSYAYISNTFFR